MRIPAIRIRQAGLGKEGKSIEIFVTALTLAELQSFATIDTWSPANNAGYQRPLEPRRFKELGKYVLEQQGILPTSVLVSVRSEDDVKPVPVDFESDPDGRALGWIEFPDGVRLWLVDGQHRFSGVSDAFQRGAEGLASYPFPVSIMWEVDRYDEMTQFNIINTRQKKMSTDIVDRHLVQIQEREGLKMLAQGTRGEKEYLRASTTRVVDKLNDDPNSPWYHQIAIPGVATRDKGLVRQHAFVASLEPFMKDSWVRGRPSEDDRAKVLVNFWSAAADVWPEAFADPKAYRVQTTVGIYSLHMMLPVLLQKCLESRDFTKARMASLLRGTGIDSEFWSRENGDPRTLGTGMSSIRLLAHYLVQELPDSDAGEVRL